MILRLPSFHKEMDLREERIFTWEIASRPLYYRIVYSLHAIAAGDEPLEDVFFTDGEKRLDAKKLLCVVSDPWGIHLAGRRATARLYSVLEDALNAEYEKKMSLFEHYQKMADLITELAGELPMDVQIGMPLSLPNILKSMDVSLSTKAAPDIKSKLLDMIDANATLRMSEVIALINFRPLLTPDDEQEVFKHAMYTKVKLLFVEMGECREVSRYEIKWVIAADYDEFILRG
jgi:CRISPR type II-A-associated protein Csn2